uniref:Uncharacterized protein n=1 Tax=Cannabis sativa TaxID=3483 RepID=A0A803QUC2_CANSA
MKSTQLTHSIPTTPMLSKIRATILIHCSALIISVPPRNVGGCNLTNLLKIESLCGCRVILGLATTGARIGRITGSTKAV